MATGSLQMGVKWLCPQQVTQNNQRKKLNGRGWKKGEGRPGAGGGSSLGRSSTDREAPATLVLVSAGYRGGA